MNHRDRVKQVYYIVKGFEPKNPSTAEVQRVALGYYSIGNADRYLRFLAEPDVDDITKRHSKVNPCIPGGPFLACHRNLGNNQKTWEIIKPYEPEGIHQQDRLTSHAPVIEDTENSEQLELAIR